MSHPDEEARFFLWLLTNGMCRHGRKLGKCRMCSEEEKNMKVFKPADDAVAEAIKVAKSDPEGEVKVDYASVEDGSPLDVKFEIVSTGDPRLVNQTVTVPDCRKKWSVSWEEVYEMCAEVEAETFEEALALAARLRNNNPDLTEQSQWMEMDDGTAAAEVCGVTVVAEYDTSRAIECLPSMNVEEDEEDE